MMSFWEVWAVPTGNLIAARSTESEALAVVRELLSVDWTADELTLLYDDPVLPVEALPAALTGDDLARRVAAAVPQDAHRTA